MTLDRLLEPQRKYAFLVGAGISHEAPSCLPLANQFILNLMDELPLSSDERSVLKSKTQSGLIRFEQVLEAVQRHFDPTLRILDGLSQCRTPNLMHGVLAAAAARGVSVFTTNFDSLIEIAGHEIGVRLETFYRDEEFMPSLLGGRRGVWKLHGSLLDTNGDDRRESIAATLSQIGRLGESFATAGARGDALRSIVESADLVVLGYSGTDDFDIIPAIASYRTDMRLVWCVHSEADTDITVCGVSELGAATAGAADAINTILAHGGWTEEHIFVIRGRTARIVEEVAKAFALPCHDQARERFALPPAFMTDWRYDFALERWRTRAFVADLYCDLGLWESARRAYKEAIAETEEMRERFITADMLGALGRCDVLAERWADAATSLERAIELESQPPEYRPSGTHVFNLAVCKAHMGNIAQAEETLSQIEQADGRPQPGTVAYLRAFILERGGDEEGSIAFLRKSLEENRRDGRLGGIARSCARLSEYHLRRHEMRPALERLYEGLRACELTRERVVASGLYRDRAMMFMRLGLLSAAYRDLKRARSLFAESEGHPLVEVIQNSITRLVSRWGDLRQRLGVGQGTANSESYVVTLYSEPTGSVSFVSKSKVEFLPPEETLDPRARRRHDQSRAALRNLVTSKEIKSGIGIVAALTLAVADPGALADGHEDQMNSFAEDLAGSGMLFAVDSLPTALDIDLVVSPEVGGTPKLR